MVEAAGEDERELAKDMASAFLLQSRESLWMILASRRASDGLWTCEKRAVARRAVAFESGGSLYPSSSGTRPPIETRRASTRMGVAPDGCGSVRSSGRE